jgi:hypothetical protein
MMTWLKAKKWINETIFVNNTLEQADLAWIFGDFTEPNAAKRVLDPNLSPHYYMFGLAFVFFAVRTVLKTILFLRERNWQIGNVYELVKDWLALSAVGLAIGMSLNLFLGPLLASAPLLTPILFLGALGADFIYSLVQAPFHFLWGRFYLGKNHPDYELYMRKSAEYLNTAIFLGVFCFAVFVLFFMANPAAPLILAATPLWLSIGGVAAAAAMGGLMLANLILKGAEGKASYNKVLMGLGIALTAIAVPAGIVGVLGFAGVITMGVVTSAFLLTAGAGAIAGTLIALTVRTEKDITNGTGKLRSKIGMGLTASLTVAGVTIGVLGLASILPAAMATVAAVALGVGLVAGTSALFSLGKMVFNRAKVKEANAQIGMVSKTQTTRKSFYHGYFPNVHASAVNTDNVKQEYTNIKDALETYIAAHNTKGSTKKKMAKATLTMLKVSASEPGATVPGNKYKIGGTDITHFSQLDQTDFFKKQVRPGFGKKGAFQSFFNQKGTMESMYEHAKALSERFESTTQMTDGTGETEGEALKAAATAPAA